jgi:hypothetical protein
MIIDTTHIYMIDNALKMMITKSVNHLAFRLLLV